MDIDTRPIVRKAVELAGTQQALADRLSEVMGRKIKQQHVWRWLNTVRVIPGEYVIPLETVIGAEEVTRHVIRPDLYPIDGQDSRRQA